MISLLISNLRILLVCIKFLRLCLCPHCLVEKGDVPKMNTPTDMKTCRSSTQINDQLHKKVSQAHKYIFKHGVSVNGICCIEAFLEDKSLVSNRFVLGMALLRLTNITIESFLTVYHRWKLQLFPHIHCGSITWIQLEVWKTIFTYLMCILCTGERMLIQQLNFRCCCSPSFVIIPIRWGTIWFQKNASAMRCLVV